MTEAIVAEARRWIGTPYHIAASAQGVGCDCLGLIRGIWRFLNDGLEPEPYRPVGSEDWHIANPTGLLDAADRHLVPISSVAHGAVAMIETQRSSAITHCGIVTSEDTIIHAYNSPSAGIDSVVEMPYQGALLRRTHSLWRFP